jgi:large conductance mechanosensitive channel
MGGHFIPVRFGEHQHSPFALCQPILEGRNRNRVTLVVLQGRRHVRPGMALDRSRFFDPGLAAGRCRGITDCLKKGDRRAMKILQEFRDFVSRGNVIDLAVGIVIGAAFTGIVTSLVNDLLMPPIGYVLGGLDFSDYFISLSGGEFPTLKAAKEAGAATLNYGLFVNAVIKFLIVAVAVFFLVRQVNRFRRQEAAVAPPSDLQKQLVVLEQIRDSLKKD